MLGEHIGRQRRPFLVLDSPEAVAETGELTARGAAIRGIANFASQTTFAMRGGRDGDLVPDFDSVTDFFAANRNSPILIFGFTFIIWTRFVMEAERHGIRFDAPQAQVLHSGGWKKLTAQAVSKDVFIGRTAAVLGCRLEAVLDFYGMVEQVGTVFVDCESGSKHAPAFADVIVRRPYTLAPVEPGGEGIIEVLSVLPSSYPGQALLTEDQGRVIGVDDCPCGRKGRYFRFTSRVERTEVRGCGDIFGQARGALMRLRLFDPQGPARSLDSLAPIVEALRQRREFMAGIPIRTLLALMDDFSRRILDSPGTCRSRAWRSCRAG